MNRIVIALALALLSFPASAATVIHNDHGGVIREYAARFAAIGHRHERLVIDGACMSACTMALSVPGMCVTPRAMFGFHAARENPAYNAPISAAGTAYLMAHYPSTVRRWIASRGGLGRGLLILQGRELAGMAKMCPR